MTSRGAAEWRRRTEAAAARFRVDELVGLPVAEARAIVEGAGGIFVDLGAGTPMTADFRTDRVLADTREGRVTATRIV